MTEIDHVLLGRIGAARLHSLYNAKELTKAARAAFNTRFDDEVDPERILDPADRAARATSARKAYMLGLSMKSAKVRRERAAAR
jgi:hypothetical protein